jgi:hypothetical protein
MQPASASAVSFSIETSLSVLVSLAVLSCTMQVAREVHALEEDDDETRGRPSSMLMIVLLPATLFSVECHKEGFSFRDDVAAVHILCRFGNLRAGCKVLVKEFADFRAHPLNVPMNTLMFEGVPVMVR